MKFLDTLLYTHFCMMSKSPYDSQQRDDQDDLKYLKWFQEKWQIYKNIHIIERENSNCEQSLSLFCLMKFELWYSNCFLSEQLHQRTSHKTELKYPIWLLVCLGHKIIECIQRQGLLLLHRSAACYELPTEYRGTEPVIRVRPHARTKSQIFLLRHKRITCPSWFMKPGGELNRQIYSVTHGQINRAWIWLSCRIKDVCAAFDQTKDVFFTKERALLQCVIKMLEHEELADLLSKSS